MAQAMKKLTTQALKHNYAEAITTGFVSRASSTFWSNVPMGPPDVILGITEAYKRDSDPKKVNLGVGAYRDDQGKPFILPSVQKAEEILFKKGLNHEYAPIGGEAAYTDAVAKLAFGEDSAVIKNKSNCTVQTLSGTGALRLGLEFVTKHYAKNKEIWLSTPTWGNHPQICNTLNLPHKKYRYFDAKTNGFDLKGALEDICKIPEGSIILLHACAHNPTGVDPRPEEWKQLSQVIKEKKLLPFIDMAYQGFATGSVDNDAFAVRQFVNDGHQFILAQSFAKNMGLYGERAGALTLLCGDAESAAKVMSQVKIMIRTMYSNPPLYGARLVTEILTDAQLKQQWLSDVKLMADRIISMRKQLRAGIEGAGNKQPWQHITDQIGMFCFTGLKPDQVERLTKEFHIYLTKDGRISVAGISSKNVDYVAEAIHKVTS
ncbi:aspartate aminotransferase, mitochondrial [Bicyclus anynana]|uniref:Aspartate aminotransferase n=1 Tax=Bicyclus anynana TaxID=110368 RepID=A0A6J1NV54_BICAN|nr:aspartate aminotransferase, mitochondrial [Bicyclus anynana]